MEGEEVGRNMGAPDELTGNMGKLAHIAGSTADRKRQAGQIQAQAT
jgi:hypothetical protein